MKKVFVLLLFGALLLTACTQGGENALPSSGAVQEVQVMVRGGEYIFSPAIVEAGKPVKLLFDPSGLPGCSRAVMLPGYGISKTMKAGDSTMEFTPKEAGPIEVACTMNMYRGTLMAE